MNIHRCYSSELTRGTIDLCRKARGLAPLRLSVKKRYHEYRIEARVNAAKVPLSLRVDT
nr:MAG TPA: Nucleolar RNA-binding protein, Nop10p family [Siphoviridae sp. ctELO16]